MWTNLQARRNFGDHGPLCPHRDKRYCWYMQKDEAAPGISAHVYVLILLFYVRHAVLVWIFKNTDGLLIPAVSHHLSTYRWLSANSAAAYFLGWTFNAYYWALLKRESLFTKQLVDKISIGVNLPKNLRGTRSGLSPSNASKFLKVVNTPPSP